jgi:hypothetical protein
MSKIPIQKTVFLKDDYLKVIDTQFNQLLRSETEEVTPSFTIDDFFQLYEDLFYQIPKEGDTNSHQYILRRESEYLGINVDTEDIQALLDEITSLRRELLDTQQTINDLIKK